MVAPFRVHPPPLCRYIAVVTASSRSQLDRRLEGGVGSTPLQPARLRPEARWIATVPAAGEGVRGLMQALLLPEPVCRLLVARGYGDVEAAKRFLRPRLEHLSAPDTLRDLPRAVESLCTGTTTWTG